MKEVVIYGLKTAGGSSSAFPLGLDADDRVGVSVTETGVARTTNPTAVSDAGMVQASYDDLGRQLIVPHQVRDLVVTAQASTATLAEVTLLAGSAGVFHDLVEITCANNTSSAIRISLRDATTGGIVKTFNILASDTVAQTFPVPVPQNTAAAAWTIQNAGSGDISNTDITISATFIKNI